MVNSSLAYEILLYINSFYFGLFATCELGTLILKSVLLAKDYDGTKKIWDFGVLTALLIVEGARLVLGRRGSLSEKDPPVLFSVVLTVPSLLSVLYMLILQTKILRIEYSWCALLLCIQLAELVFACMFIVSMFRRPSYD